MATMCRAIIMTRFKTAHSLGLPHLVSAALLSVLIAAPCDAQETIGTSSLSFPASSQGSSIGKSGPAAQGPGPSIIPNDLSELRIEPGDLLSVNVYDTPELTGSYRVEPSGDLAIPMCGKVSVSGLTMPEAAKRLEAALKDSQILNQPQVNVDVLQYGGQYVTVLGEVESPGRVALIGPAKLGDILSQVGGVTPLASARIKIRRGADDAAPEEEVAYTRNQANRETASILVRPGDSVLVPRAGIVYVLGAVFKPGGYIMQEDGKLNVAEALALGGGTLPLANTGGLRVIRRHPDGTVLDFPLSYDAIAKGTQAPLALEPRDIVYVPMSKVKSTLSSAESIIGEAAYAAIVSRP